MLQMKELMATPEKMQAWFNSKRAEFDDLK